MSMRVCMYAARKTKCLRLSAMVTSFGHSHVEMLRFKLNVNAPKFCKPTFALGHMYLQTIDLEPCAY